jgi:hypothetical protein
VAKKKVTKQAKVEKQKKNNSWIIIAAIVIIALVAIFSSMYMNPTANTGGTYQGGDQPQGQGQIPSTELTGDGCRRDLECQLVNCKSTPSIVECVNATHQDLYFKQCSEGRVNVATYDFSRCGCVQGICKIK